MSQQETVELTLADLQLIKNIIEASTKRGTFEAQELAAVGTVYNKLSSFIETVQKNAEQQKNNTATNTTEGE